MYTCVGVHVCGCVHVGMHIYLSGAILACILIAASYSQVEEAAREAVAERQAEEAAGARAPSPLLNEQSRGAPVVVRTAQNGKRGHSHREFVELVDHAQRCYSPEEDRRREGKRGRSQRESLDHAQQSYLSEEERRPAEKRCRPAWPAAEARLW